MADSPAAPGMTALSSAVKRPRKTAGPPRRSRNLRPSSVAAGPLGNAAEEHGAESAADLVADRVAQDGTEYHERQHPAKADVVKRGQYTSQHDSRLARQHESDEDAGLPETKGANDQIGRKPVK